VVWLQPAPQAFVYVKDSPPDMMLHQGRFFLQFFKNIRGCKFRVMNNGANTPVS
jgi:hypothetical protein